MSKLRAESKIRTAIEQLPKTLDEFYNRILLDIEEPDQEHARLALRWLAFAARPISLKELAEAVIIRCNDEPYVNDEDRFLDYKDILEILPSGLVSKVAVLRGSSEDYFEYDLDSDSEYANSEAEEENKDVDEHEQRHQQRNDSFKDKPEVQNEGKAKDIKSRLLVQFAHFSVKEYLISDRSGLKYHIDEISANKVIAESCFAYLIHTGIQEPAITSKIYRDFPLLHYAANCWPYHVHMLHSQSIDEHLLKLALYFLQNDSCAWRVWAAVGFDDYLGLDSLETLASRGRKISTGKSPIHPVSWVSGLGLSCLLQHLLVESIHLNEIPQTRNFCNPLYVAAYKGHLQVVQMLLTAGSNLNREGGFYGYALQVASRRGHTEIVCLLLQAGADVNARGGNFGSALQAASTGGHLEIVRLLLQAGADVNAQCGEFGSALQAAPFRGHIEIVRSLLQAGANVNAQGGFYGSALQVASTGGHLEIVRFLLQVDADINAQGGKFGSALQAASSEGHIETVCFLLQVGADINAQGGIFGSALQAASTGGHLETVRFLLQAGVDVNAQGGKFGSALQAASSEGHIEIVRFLLQAGADVDAQGGKFGSALQAASSEDHIETVRFLLQAGADINAQGGKFGSALQAASTGGHLERVRFLLQAGADVNAQGGEFGSALRAAASHGWKDVVQMLLDSGADNRADGQWDVMYKKVEDEINELEELMPLTKRDRLDRLRATKFVLDGWLAVKQSKEAEEANCLGAPKITETGKQLAATISDNSL